MQHSRSFTTFFVFFVEFKFPNLRYKGTAADGGGPPPQRIRKKLRAKVEEIVSNLPSDAIKDLVDNSRHLKSAVPFSSSSAAPSSSSAAPSSSSSSSPAPASSSKKISAAASRAKAILENPQSASSLPVIPLSSSAKPEESRETISPRNDRVCTVPEYSLFYKTIDKLVPAEEYKDPALPFAVQVLIQLPGVSASSELDVEASALDICVQSLVGIGVPHNYLLNFPLPYKCDDESAGGSHVLEN